MVNNPRKGFALVVVAVILAIAGIIMFAMIPTQSDRLYVQVADTSQRLKTIERAMDTYQASHSSKYPCPASRTFLSSNAAYGKASACSAAAVCVATTGVVCSGNVAIGTVPFEALGLSEEMMYDSWGNRFIYALDVNQTAGGGSGNTLGITSADASITYSKKFFIVSAGPNGKGAYNKVGVKEKPCGAAIDAENCDDDKDFIDDQYQVDASNIYTFDDIMLHVPPAPPAVHHCPAEVANCTFWVDANDTNGDRICRTASDTSDCDSVDPTNEPSDNTSFNAWVDKSVNAVTMTPANGTPKYYNTTSPINGKPRINLGSGTNQNLTATLSGGFYSQKFTLFIVARPENVDEALFSVNNSSTANYYDMSLKYQSYPNNWSLPVYAPSKFTTHTSAKSAYTENSIYTISYDNTSMYMYVNGIPMLTWVTPYYNPGQTAMARNVVTIGGKAGIYDGSTVSGGDVAEMVIYDKDLSPSQQQSVECYLATKWGISGNHCPPPSDTNTLESYCPTITLQTCNNGSSCSCPGNVYGCKAWYNANITGSLLKANGTTATNGQTAKIWCDQSGNGNNASPLGTPTVVTNSYGSGKNAVSLATGGFNLGNVTANPAFSAFFTSKATATSIPGPYNPILSNQYSTYGYYWSYSSGYKIQTDGYTNTPNFSAHVYNQPTLYSLLSDGLATTPANTSARINGLDFYYPDTAGTLLTNNYWSPVLGTNLPAEISEVVLYDRKLSPTERNLVEIAISNNSGVPVQHDSTLTASCPGPATNYIAASTAYWYDAKNAASLRKLDGSQAGNGNNVALWCDLSDSGGGGRHAVGIGADTLATNMGGSGFNGVHVGIDAKLIAPAFNYSTFTVFNVFRPHSLAAYGGYLLNVLYTGHMTWYVWGNGFFLYAKSGYVYIPNGSFSDDSNNIFVHMLDGSGNVTGRHNGTSYTPGSTAAITQTFLPLSFTEGGQGSYGELIIYPSALSPAEIKTVECSLAEKWGLCSSLLANAGATYCNGQAPSADCL